MRIATPAAEGIIHGQPAKDHGPLAHASGCPSTVYLALSCMLEKRDAIECVISPMCTTCLLYNIHSSGRHANESMYGPCLSPDTMKMVAWQAYISCHNASA